MATAKSVSNFTINKGLTNEFILTIKQNDTLLPMIIEYSDTFKLLLINLDTDQIESTIDMDSTKADGFIDVYDDANGQIRVTMNPTLTNRLEKERGPKEDRYYLKPTYRMSIECSTMNNGNFVIKLKNISVD
jgi:hypothetical protein